MAFNSATVSIGEVTKKSHFDRLMSNLFSLLKDDHTFEGTKTFDSAATFNRIATFNSGTVFAFAPTLPVGSIRSAEIDFGIAAGDVDADILPLGTAVTNSPTGGTSSNLPNTSFARAALQELFDRLIDLSGVENDAIDFRHINWGSGAGQIDTDNIPSGTTNKYLTTGTQTIFGNKSFSGTVELYSTFKVDEISTNSATNAVAIQAIYRSATSGVETTVKMKKRAVEIGDWNMTATALKNVTHGLADHQKIRSITVFIRDDSGAASTIYNLFAPFPFGSSNADDGGLDSIGSTNIVLKRKSGGAFDSGFFNSIGYNRGWVFLEYEV